MLGSYLPTPDISNKKSFASRQLLKLSLDRYLNFHCSLPPPAPTLNQESVFNPVSTLVLSVTFLPGCLVASTRCVVPPFRLQSSPTCLDFKSGVGLYCNQLTSTVSNLSPWLSSCFNKMRLGVTTHISPTPPPHRFLIRSRSLMQSGD
jgi:hypothetical protein